MLLRVFTEPQQGASYDQLLSAARLAEASGFDAFFRSDHYLRMGPGSPLPGPTDAWVTLAGLARETSTIRLGTLVSPVTFRHPGILAITVAQVDAMSGGRVELGLGTGWFDAEHHAYGIPYPPAVGDRFDLLGEQLEIVSGLWSAPDTFSFTGRHYTLTESPALPKPVQRPGPPIVMGGAGMVRTPRLAARFASEWNAPFLPFDDYAPTRGRVLAACEAIGRDPSSLVTSAALVVCIGSDDAEIRRRAEAIGREVEELKLNGICGTPAEAIEQLARWGAAGAQRVYLQLLDLDDLDHLRLIAAEVLPHVAAL